MHSATDRHASFFLDFVNIKDTATDILGSVTMNGIQKYLKYVATWYHIKVIFHFGEKGGLFNK